MEDLSHMVPSLTGASMAGTNTVSANTSMTAAGSESESTHGITAGVPGPVVPPERPRTVLHPSGQRVSSPWHRADGTAWENSSPDESGGNAARSVWGQS